MSDDSPRRARIETGHDSPSVARRVARALAPDNTARMETRVEHDRVVTEIARETTGGLHATVDDYVVNLQVAAQLTDKPDASTADGSTHQTDETHDT